MFQQRGLIAIAWGSYERGNDITVTVSESNHFVAFQMFVSAESEVIAPFLRRCCCPITVDDADVEELFLVKEHYSSREYGIEAPLSFKAPKSGIDPGVVDFRSPRFVLLNRQFFPL